MKSPGKSRTKATSTASTTATKRDRRASTWTVVAPKELASFKSANKLSDRALGAFLGVSIGTVRNWTTGNATPSEEKQKEVRAKLDAGYTAPPPSPVGKPSRRTRPTTAAPAPTSAPAASSVAEKLLDLASAYVRSRNGGVDPEDVIRFIERVKKTLGM